MTEINDKAQLDITAAGDTDAVTSDTPEETVNTPEVDETFELSAAKMREHGMSETAINQFRHLYDVWRHEEASSWIREDDIEPLGHVPSFHDVYETINHDKAVDAFAKTAFLKLNGGLGTSMGLDKAKSLLPVRRHKAKQMRFIDIIIGQVLTARTRLNVELPLTFMNSFHTSADTMKVLKHHRKFSQHDVPMEIIQHQEPKLVAATGRLILREMSQVHPDDKEAAQDITKHPYFNTNSIWVRIDALKDKLAECDGVLPLPVIRNKKTVNPTDPDSEQVIQLETAMGAAIGLFNGSICVQVDRMRFLPVKTTNDLFIMRSDRFHLTDTYEMEDGNYIFPNVELDPRYYKNIHDFDERFPYAVPSLAAANSVSIQGDWTFGRDVMMFADAKLEDKGEPSYVPNGEYVGPQGIEPDDWV